jgi:LPS-assembly protein
MTQLRAIVALTLGMLILPRVACAQAETEGSVEVTPLNEASQIEWDFRSDFIFATNGVRVTYGGAELTANSAKVNRNTGEVIADGQVRILREDQIWASEHLKYNFKTREMEAQQFRTGKQPVFIQGEGLHGDLSNRVYTATNAYVTTDDVAEPSAKVKASRITIIPGVRVTAYNAVLYVEGVPVFYFPYYSRNLGPRANNFTFIPGYRSSYGAYILGSYKWFLSDEFDGVMHLDYRARRGVGIGPDESFHFGPWGEGDLKYYYIYDQDPSASTDGPHIPAESRQRVDFNYRANPATNLQFLGVVRYQTDTNVLHDFFENEYLKNPQPSTFFELNKFWQNFSLDTYVQPRVNDFLETVERLPEVRLTGFRQELGATPLYYQSQSSLGYYRRVFPEEGTSLLATNYDATRADTYQQILLPMTFFGWLNVTPHVGGRFTYYGEGGGPRASTEEIYRGVFDTGAELSFKASRTWPGMQSQLLDMDGVRHIVQPSATYMYVPNPNYRPTEVPQFDYQFPSLRLLPIEYPDNNAIDAIDGQDVMRVGVDNKLQSKREGKLVTVVDWNLYTDWRLQTQTNQTRFSDLYSDLLFKPRSWLTLESMLRYDVEDSLWRMAYHSVTFTPNDRWSWTVAHFYLRDDTLPPLTGLGEGNNFLTSTMFYRVNENWGLRALHRFDVRNGQMQEQGYSIYRDLRNWTAALTFRVLDNVAGHEDFSVAFTFSLKAYPRFGLGQDIARPYSLLGGG